MPTGWVDASTNRAVVIQGGQHTFELYLSPAASGGTPSTPQDPDSYPLLTEPTVAVYDPDGTAIAVGVGTRVSQGYYTYLFTCPLGGVLGEEWYLQYNATIGGTFYTWRQYFKVVDRTTSNPKALDPTQLSSLKTEEFVLAIKGRAERVFIETKVGADGVAPITTPTLSLYTAGETLLTTLPVSSLNSYTFYADVPATYLTASDAHYMLVWSYRLTVSEPNRTVIQVIWTAPLSIFRALPDLRMLMDKAQKPSDKVQGYSDQELVRYLKLGNARFNSRPPMTGYSWGNMPDTAYPWVLTLAMLYGLKAQMLLEIDQDFDLSGQTISLKWDHFGNLNTFVQTAAEEWKEYGQAVKMSLALSRGRLYVVPSVQGIIGMMNRSSQSGTQFESYKM